MKQILPLFLLIFAFACSKDTNLIPGNTAPPDNTVEDQTIINYINKSYISLLSREPNSQELQTAFDALRADDFSDTSRVEFLQTVIDDPAYLDNVYANAREELLRGADTTDIYIQWNGLMQALNDPNLAPFYPLIQEEIDRMEDLMDVPEDLASGAIDVTEMYRRVVNNSLYDDFNMGTENFIISTFQFFLHRSPTGTELEECTKIVDDNEGVMFLQTGESKDDYLDIFFASDGYYEGQVIYLYEKYLFRTPLSEEMSFYAQIYKANNNYPELQTLILSQDEFAGL